MGVVSVGALFFSATTSVVPGNCTKSPPYRGRVTASRCRPSIVYRCHSLTRTPLMDDQMGLHNVLCYWPSTWDCQFWVNTFDAVVNLVMSLINFTLAYSVAEGNFAA